MRHYGTLRCLSGPLLAICMLLGLSGCGDLEDSKRVRIIEGHVYLRNQGFSGYSYQHDPLCPACMVRP